MNVECDTVVYVCVPRVHPPTYTVIFNTHRSVLPSRSCVPLLVCVMCRFVCPSPPIESAKKRLRTMLKNPTKKANANALVAHLALIQRYSKEDEEQKPIYNPVIGDFVKVDVPDNVDETTMRKIKRVEGDYDMDDGEDHHPDHIDNDMDDATVLNLGFEGLSQDDKLMIQEV